MAAHPLFHCDHGGFDSGMDTEFTQYGFRNRIVKPYKAGELHEILHNVMTDNQP